ncbi:MAG TPA: hypothetical protein VIJ07_06470 [Dermatophilaceae bacterium]|nr:hypothetical protein [Kineosporiaceae bacterium]
MLRATADRTAARASAGGPDGRPVLGSCLEPRLAALLVAVRLPVPCAGAVLDRAMRPRGGCS